MIAELKDFREVVKKMNKAAYSFFSPGSVFGYLKFIPGSIQAGSSTIQVTMDVPDVDFSCLVHGVSLEKILNKLNGKTVIINMEGKELYISTGIRKFKLPTMNVNEYPVKEDITAFSDAKNIIKFPEIEGFANSSDLIKTLANFVYKGDARPVLGCVRFNDKHIIATDSIKAICINTVEDVGDFLISWDAIRLALLFDVMSYYVAEDKVIFYGTEGTVVAGKSAGLFPDMNNLFNGSEKVGRISSPQLINSLTASLALETKDSPIVVSLKTEGEIVSVSYQGTTGVFLDKVEYEGSPWEGQVNAKNLLPCVQEEVWINKEGNILGFWNTQHSVNTILSTNTLKR